MTGYARSRVLHKLADLMEERLEELAAIETLDNGKPLSMSKGMDLPGSVTILRSLAGWGDKISGDTCKVNGPYQAYTLYEPIGVAAAIIPWNFPIASLIIKAAPALVAGCTMVLKPAEQTPLTALFIAALAKEAGIPPGVLNILPGFGPTTGAAIASHMDVDKISFTGSTEVGRLIMEASAKSNLKPVTLELGGKSPLIICEDADVDIAVEIASLGLFFNMGQCCVASSRIFVQEGMYNEFLRKASEKARNRVVGDPFQAGVQQGPQVDETQFKKILGYIESGKTEGAKLLTGGKRIGEAGYFIEPTVFGDVKDDMKIAKEEIFGPVMSVLRFKSLDEVVKRANDTMYGLAAGIVTNDLNVANRLSRSIRAGTIWINCYHVSDPALPFGGYKMSGIGREQSLQAVLNYMQLKTVVTPVHDSPWL
ncbi:hypothetical protein KP509_21G072200 [Ceratopteris richardii]|nr:hypothetical protein KP509_21G072200 [Ceratopteris richardii]